MLVVSPFSAGGWVCSDAFDHTSQLQFLATLFNVTVPNVSAWRSSTVGNLMSALPTLGRPDVTIPRLPVVSGDQSVAPIDEECDSEQLFELNPDDGAYPVPRLQRLPRQSAGSLRSTSV